MALSCPARAPRAMLSPALAVLMHGAAVAGLLVRWGTGISTPVAPDNGGRADLCRRSADGELPPQPHRLPRPLPSLPPIYRRLPRSDRAAHVVSGARNPRIVGAEWS